MNERDLQEALADLPLGSLRYLPSIGSTNDEALIWAAQGAPDLSIVIADEQTAGRGRAGRKWFTPAGSALAFSVILRPVARAPGSAGVEPGKTGAGAAAAGNPHHSRTVGLAALAVAASLRTRSLNAEIKWPNDILVDGRKIAGILLESVWIGERVDFTIVGIGVNIARSAVPPADTLNFPATSLEEVMGAPQPREPMLHDILDHLLRWRPRLATDEFMRAWEGALAFRGQQVLVTEGNDSPESAELLGLAADGSLYLRAADGRLITRSFGDVGLRPAL